MPLRPWFDLCRPRSRRTHRQHETIARRRRTFSVVPFESLEPRSLLAGEVVINELHYNPDIETQLVEFIELYNTTSAPIDLSNWLFSRGVTYVFPQNATIAAAGYYVIAENAAQFQSKFGFAPNGVYTGGLDGEAETVELRTAADVEMDEVDYQIGFPWPTVGDQIATPGDGRSIQLINPGLDNGVGGSWRSAIPTPRAQNSVFAANAPPAMRQVDHAYSSNGLYAAPGDTVTITARVTDPEGVQSVVLAYQIVEPGQYIEINTAAYNTNWTTVAMRDDGLNGDAAAGDGIYSVVLPASLQQHRRLIRYRLTATDNLGASITGPYADDPQPNFAYYVYGNTPSWIGAVQPGVTPPVTYSPVLLDSLPTYQLITTRSDHETAQRIPNSTQAGYTGSDYLWQGALVYNGEVYDHVRHRARGGVWRYAMGKNMWKFDFNRGHYFQAHDDYGQPYEEKWKKLNFSAIIQQGNFNHRGEQGLFEAVGFKLFNLAGVESPLTHYVHFRVVENANENGANQYSGDFQGLYLAIEQPDGQLLEQHGLPDGNFYKMEGGTGTLNNQGPTQPSNRSDLNQFLTTYINSTPSEQWWRENFDLQRYYSYRSIVEAIHHYDIDESAGKNYFYYHNPETGKWSVHAWDLDLTWANNMFGNGDEPFRDRVLPRPEFGVEYRNRLREIRDLLYNSEQTGMIIDEFAQHIYRPGQPSWTDADRAMWDDNPILASSYVNSSKAGHGRFYQQAATDDFPGMMQILKNYIVSRGAFIDNTLLTDDSQVPQRPTITYSGPAGFPADGLTFNNSGFASPAGSSFAGLEWRIAEVSDPTNPNFDSAEPRSYEMTPTWQSGRLTTFSSSATVPGDSLRIGETYRVRVRYQDAAGRWSHWSQPVQFVAGTPLVAAQDKIRITELNFHPAVPTAVEIAAGFTDKEAFEFIEIQNIHSQPVNVAGYQFSQGVEFTFPSIVLEPGQRTVVVADQQAFEFRYGLGTRVAGEFSDGRLNNAGEQLIFVTGGEQPVVGFTYDDAWYPATDGPGMSLVIVDGTAPLEVDPVSGQSQAWSRAASWRPSTNPLGSPGLQDPASGVTVPAKPTGVAATSPLWSQVNLTWTDGATNETGFKVERRAGTAGDWSEVATLPAGTQAFRDNNLQPVTQYFYRVRAFNGAGASAATDPVSVTTQAPPLPAAPSGLTADSSLAGQVDLSWADNSSEETLFRIERKAGALGAWEEVGTVGTNVTTFTSSGLMPNTTYFFRVRAANTGGNSDYSNEASATTGAGIPNLAGQWLFDDPAGDNTVRDTSFTGNHGALNNGVQRIVGTNGARAGNAVAFDGINDYIGTSRDLAAVLGGTATLVTWVRTAVTGDNTFWMAPGITGVEQSGAGNDVFWGWVDASGRIGIQAGNTAGAKTAQPINDNQWHHVAFTRNATSGRVEVYVDGQLSGSATSEPGVKTTPFRGIGRIEDTAGTHEYFNGRLDELKIFDRVLSQAEIQSLRLTNIVRQGTAGIDAFTINRSTTNGYIRIYLNQATNTTPSYAIQPDLLGSLQIDGLAGNDSLNININGTAGYPLRAGGLVFTGGDGDDSLTLNGNTSSGTVPHTFHAGAGTNTLTVNSGQISLDGVAPGGVLNTTVATGASLVTTRLNQNGLTVNGNGRVTLLPGGGEVNVLTSLNLAGGATLDVNDTALVIDYTGGSPAATIRASILSGRGGPGLGASWNGTGITSSAAAAANAAEPDSRSIGYADNASLPLGAYTVFRGHPVDPTSILIAYTRTGDANLDGLVDDNDATILGASYAPVTPNASWSLADFDYNGFIDDDDATLLGAFYKPLPAPPPPSFPGSAWERTAPRLRLADPIVEVESTALIDLLAAVAADAESINNPRIVTSRRTPAADAIWATW
ncbi:MAG: lamin tail domain-containing protein [Pirellulales bacterium]